jgi:hypothetical protein
MPAAEFARWGKRDPIGLYEEWLARGDRELAPCVGEAGEVREAEGDGGDGGGGTAKRSAARARPRRSSAARQTANRAALDRIEFRVAAEVAAAEREALASRDLPFTDADATDGVYEIP